MNQTHRIHRPSIVRTEAQAQQTRAQSRPAAGTARSVRTARSGRTARSARQTTGTAHSTRSGRIAQLAAALLLLALFAMACSGGESPRLVDTLEPAATAPLDGDGSGSATASTDPAPAQPEQPAQPAQTTGPTEGPPPEEVVITTAPVTPPDVDASGSGSLPQLSRTNVSSPYGDSFSATVLIANGSEQRRVPLYDTPGGNEIILPDGGLWYRSYYGGPLVMELVSGSQFDAWVQVNVAARQLDSQAQCTVPPCYRNEVSGWVQNDGYEWFTHKYHARIDLTERSVRVWNGSELVAESLAVIGRPSRETPLGTFFLKERLPPRNAAYGPHVLSLSAYSEQLQSFQGGLPNIALHGTNQPELIGQAVSSGCVRVPNDVITTIFNSAPLGTIFEITA